MIVLDNELLPAEPVPADHVAAAEAVVGDPAPVGTQLEHAAGRAVDVVADDVDVLAAESQRARVVQQRQTPFQLLLSPLTYCE